MTISAPRRAHADDNAPGTVKLGPFDAEFLADLPYDPSVLFFDELLEVDAARSLVRCRMPTDRPMPLVDPVTTAVLPVNVPISLLLVCLRGIRCFPP